MCDSRGPLQWKCEEASRPRSRSQQGWGTMAPLSQTDKQMQKCYAFVRSVTNSSARDKRCHQQQHKQPNQSVQSVPRNLHTTQQQTTSRDNLNRLRYWIRSAATSFKLQALVFRHELGRLPALACKRLMVSWCLSILSVDSGKQHREGEQRTPFAQTGKASLLSVVSSWFVVLAEIDAGDAHFSYIYCSAMVEWMNELILYVMSLPTIAAKILSYWGEAHCFAIDAELLVSHAN
jgi:hypothetical protein